MYTTFQKICLLVHYLFIYEEINIIYLWHWVEMYYFVE